MHSRQGSVPLLHIDRVHFVLINLRNINGSVMVIRVLSLEGKTFGLDQSICEVNLEFRSNFSVIATRFAVLRTYRNSRNKLVTLLVISVYVLRDQYAACSLRC
jgi:hypothetical protein